MEVNEFGQQQSVDRACCVNLVKERAADTITMLNTQFTKTHSMTNDRSYYKPTKEDLRRVAGRKRRVDLNEMKAESLGSWKRICLTHETEQHVEHTRKIKHQAFQSLAENELEDLDLVRTGEKLKSCLAEIDSAEVSMTRTEDLLRRIQVVMRERQASYKQRWDCLSRMELVWKIKRRLAISRFRELEFKQAFKTDTEGRPTKRRASFTS